MSYEINRNQVNPLDFCLLDSEDQHSLDALTQYIDSSTVFPDSEEIVQVVCIDIGRLAIYLTINREFLSDNYEHTTTIVGSVTLAGAEGSIERDVQFVSGEEQLIEVELSQSGYVSRDLGRIAEPLVYQYVEMILRCVKEFEEGDFIEFLLTLIALERLVTATPVHSKNYADVEAYTSTRMQMLAERATEALAGSSLAEIINTKTVEITRSLPDRHMSGERYKIEKVTRSNPHLGDFETTKRKVLFYETLVMWDGCSTQQVEKMSSISMGNDDLVPQSGGAYKTIFQAIGREPDHIRFARRDPPEICRGV